MMKKCVYNVVYKCRLCGKTYEDSTLVATQLKLLQLMDEVDTTGDAYLSPTDGIGVHKVSQHHCKDGSMGLADFIGFRFVEEFHMEQEDEISFYKALYGSQDFEEEEE